MSWILRCTICDEIIAGSYYLSDEHVHICIQCFAMFEAAVLQQGGKS